MSAGKVEVRFAQEQFDRLYGHLYPGDDREHAAVLLASLVERRGKPARLLVREVIVAVDGVDYGVSPEGYGRVQASFINRAIIKASRQRLVYLHVHNHLSDRSVAFSRVDMASHERGYPALLDIADGMPVGALVFGARSLQIDLWWPDKTRSSLSRCLAVGSRVTRLFSSPKEAPRAAYSPEVDRQVRFLGEEGQALLADATVAVIGLGGVGSMVVQDLARLGVGRLLLVDTDRLEASNLSRVVTATHADVKASRLKTELAERYARAVNPAIAVESIAGDMADEDVAARVAEADFIFLCADTMRARLVVNAIVHQHLVPAVQIGSKILQSTDGRTIEQFYSVVRQIRPGLGCLICNELISPHRLAIEEKSDEDWRAQNYGVETPNPSVITLNGIGSSRATHDFLMDFVGTDFARPSAAYAMYDVAKGNWIRTNPRRDEDCTECSTAAESRLASGDRHPLPCRQGRRESAT